MKFDLGSFLFGCAVGVGAALLAPRLRPLALELATGVYRLGDAVALRAARSREDLQDLLAEAKACARGVVYGPHHPAGGATAQASRAAAQA